MNQCELNRAVARATGETVATVKRMGFLLAEIDTPEQMPGGPDSNIAIIDWDQLARLRSAEGGEARNRELVSPS